MKRKSDPLPFFMHLSLYVWLMKPVLFRHPHIEIRQSSIHGYGIFAKEDIASNTVLEEVPFIYVPYEVKPDYLFAYPRGGTPVEDMTGVKSGCALPFGYACLYNHAEYAEQIQRTVYSYSSHKETFVKMKSYLFTTDQILTGQNIRMLKRYKKPPFYRWCCFTLVD